MLKTMFITFDFSRFCQSGFYFDFFYKKVSEVFVRNVFIYTAQFLGEKYLIEFVTKKLLNNSIFGFNKLFGLKKLNHDFFFTSFLLPLIYCLIFINFIFLFF